MTFINFGQEGENLPKDVVLDISQADVDHRGSVPFLVNEFSQYRFATTNEVWYHGKVVIPSISNTPNSSAGRYEFFAIKDANGILLMSAQSRRITNPDVPPLFIRGVFDDTNGISDMLSYGDFPTGAEVRFDFHLKLTGLTLELEAYINGSIVAARTIVGVAPVWGAPAMAAFGHYGPGNALTLWHEVGVSTEPTIGIGISTLEASAPGFHSDGIGSYTGITNPGVDLTTTMSLLNVGDKTSWIVTPLVGKSFGTSSIKNIILSAVAVNAGVAVTGYRYFIRSGGTDFPTAGGTIPVSNLMGNITEEVLINPATGVAFTVAEVSAGIEVGIEAM